MKRPNILLFLIDDLGWRDLGCFGSNFYETPNIDKLASEGMSFQNAYASCPVCSPTRASIMSGKYPARVGITQWIGGHLEGKLKDVPYLHYLPLEEKSIASSLKEGGYQTWHVGKWHLGDEEFFPEKHGFDVNIAGCHKGHPHDGYFSPYNLETLEDGPEGEYLTDRLSDEAINLIQNKNPNKPFFLNMSHYAVHTPIQAPEALIQKYKDKAKRLLLDQIDPFIEGDYLGTIDKSDIKQKRRILQSDPIYAAMIENLDMNIGKILDTLKSQGLEEDTVVCFTSDNGGLATIDKAPTCNAPLSEGKGYTYEGGTRICQMIKWPGNITPGSQTSENVTSTDFYPTFLEMANLPLNHEQHKDGISLLPLLTENKKLDRQYLYWHFPHYSNGGGRPAASILDGEWKLIQHFENNALELYNLKSDISESIDVSKQHPQIIQRLFSALKKWQEELGALTPAKNPDYEKLLKRPLVDNNAYD